MKSAFWFAIAGICLSLLGGCASPHAVDRGLRVSPEMRQEVERLVAHEKVSNQLVYQLGTAGADACTDAPLHYRSPFSLLYNNAGLPSAEMRKAIFDLEGIEDQALLQTHLPALQAYDGARVVAVNGISTRNPGKVLGTMLEALEQRRPLDLKLEDGRYLQAAGQPGCPSLVGGDFTGKGRSVENFGIYEVVPTAWAKVVRTPDETAFVLARSIYFTGAEGRLKLRNALFAGAAVSGVLRALTFGVSAIVADPKHIAVQARRRANRADADAFAVRLMARAGFDTGAALVFAERSLAEGTAWPEECDELRFDRERLDALRALLLQKS